MLREARLKRVSVAAVVLVGLAWLGWTAAARVAAQEILAPESPPFLGGGGFGGETSTASVMLAISQTGKTAYAYSTHTGKWEKTRLNPADNAVVPVVSAEVICFIQGNKAYAFGGLSGRWDAVDLPGPAEPIVSTNSVRIDVGSRIYMFSSAAGKWAAVDLAAD